MIDNLDIEKVARELIEGINKQKTRKKENKIQDIHTLCNFGVLGLLTPKELIEATSNSLNEIHKDKKYPNLKAREQAMEILVLEHPKRFKEIYDFRVKVLPQMEKLKNVRRTV